MEFIANLQSRHDDLKPSLFDILAENQLSALLPPSIRYLLVLATHRHPRYLLRILNSFDELYAFLSLVVERHFLRSYGGTFTENFYGLKRERVLRIRNGEVPRAQIGAQSLVRDALKLQNSDIWKNLAVVVGIPYLKRKLDESYDIHAAHFQVLGQARAAGDTLPADATYKQRFLYYYKWFLRKVYPSVNAAFWFSTLLFNMAYLFDGTKYSSPLLWLIGTRIRRMGPADYKAIDEAEQRAAAKIAAKSVARTGLGTSIFNPRVLGNIVVPTVLRSLRLLLPASIFALKFLEWWHASDFSSQLSRKATEGLELPPPILPQLPSVALSPERERDGSERQREKGMDGLGAGREDEEDKPTKRVISKSTGLPILTVPAPTPATSGDCPICGNTIVNPTAAPSGYVYCYVCIHRWVEGEHERQLEFLKANNAVADGDGVSGDGRSVEDDEEIASASDRRSSRRSSADASPWGTDDGDYDDAVDEGPEAYDGEEDDGGKEIDGFGGNAFSRKSPVSGLRPSAGRFGDWEIGKGRCAVTGMLILGGTESLRRVIV